MILQNKYDKIMAAIESGELPSIENMSDEQKNELIHLQKKLIENHKRYNPPVVRQNIIVLQSNNLPEMSEISELHQP
jgi:hypothetical protein